MPAEEGDKKRESYLYFWVWLTALIAVNVPFILPALLYPFINLDAPWLHDLYFNTVLFAAIGPILLFWFPIILMMAAYFEGLTSGIWIDPNNQIMYWIYSTAAFAWTLFGINYMVSIIPPLKIWKFT